jgi:oligopeptidase B
MKIDGKMRHCWIGSPSSHSHSLTVADIRRGHHCRAHGNLEHDTTNLRISFSSPCTPESVFDYDIVKRTKEVRKVQKVPSGHNADDYVCKRLQVPAHDGVMIPITVLHRKDTPIDGSSPCLLYGYGSYGISMPAEFSTNRLSMVRISRPK